MSIEQTNSIDFATIDEASGDLWLTISDHLPWEEHENEHLVLLQEKLNAYLRFIESGEVLAEVADAKGRSIVINLVAKFPLSERADLFFQKAAAAIGGAGFRLQFKLMPRN
jgi:CRP-like cAMP-binding protein